MQNIILEVINHFGYIGIGLLIAIENIFPPIPSEIILTFGGFMTTFSNMNLLGCTVAATIGSVFGAIVLYFLGRGLNSELFTRLFDSKLAKKLHLKKEDVITAGEWFNKYGNKAVFFCRFVPVIRSLVSIPAGMAKMNLISFLSLTLLGTLIWNMVLVYLGMLAGDNWETVASYMDFYSMISASFLLIATLLIGAVFIKKRFF
ncbi:DedA family protein [Terrisporobacter petrolearius]|uniref:DedA family protein n=1 Tax=Terrisporobacter petrolearius TaxID=1460447 RepID=UPI001D16335E|nr:DedA family protein [Terrisporobacter petrolearius]MCC3863766.1 DedA family protein [Terrisporobacter petrolearius]